MISPHNVAMRIEGEGYRECSSRGLAWICCISDYLLSTHEPVTVLVVLETVENKTEGGLCS